MTALENFRAATPNRSQCGGPSPISDSLLHPEALFGRPVTRSPCKVHQAKVTEKEKVMGPLKKTARGRLAVALRDWLATVGTSREFA